MIELIVIFFSFLLIVVALTFLYIGYVMGKAYKEKERIEKEEKLPSVVKKEVVKGGVIDYPTQESIDYELSGERKVDEAREKLFREYFHA